MMIFEKIKDINNKAVFSGFSFLTMRITAFFTIQLLSKASELF